MSSLKIKRLSAVVSALSALTLDDLESFTTEQVRETITLRRVARAEVETLAFDQKRAAARVEEEKRLAAESKARAERGAKLADTATPVGLTDDEWACIKNEKKINAIKLVRERTGLGLADAKAHVEQIAYNYGVKGGQDHFINAYTLGRFCEVAYPYPPKGSLQSSLA